MLEEIVVTATKRPEKAIDVPIAVSAYSAATLERAGLDDLKRLQSISPSLSVTTTQGDSAGAVIRVRGIGTSGSNPGLESATGVTIDGVFLSRSNLALSDLLGIDQIELLRGPQGTLFGKNTTAGVLNVTTLQPSFTPVFDAAAEFGNYGERQFTASASGPLIEDQLAARLDVLQSERDGWLKTLGGGPSYADRDRYSLRGQFLWTPRSDLDVRAIVDYSNHDESSANPPSYRVVGPTGAVIGRFGPTPQAEWEPRSDTTQIDAASPRFDRYHDGGLSITANYDMGEGTLTSISAYRITMPSRSFDVDGSPADLLRDVGDSERYSTFTQEIRYRGVAGPLDYLVGAFYDHELIRSSDGYQAGTSFEGYVDGLTGGNLLTLFTGLPAGANYPTGSGKDDVFHQTADSYAVFTHNTLKLGERLALTAGLRYTAETKSLDADLATDGPGCAAALAKFGRSLTGIPPILQSVVCNGNFDPRFSGTYHDSKSDGEVSGTVSADYRILGRLNAYVSYSRGYKGGGYEFDRAGLLLPDPSATQLGFRPEFADSYETGLKGDFLDRTVHAELSTYFTKITDYQFNYLKVLPLQTARVTANLPELVSKGVEFEASWKASSDLTFGGAATYNLSTYGDSGFPTDLSQLQGTVAPFAPRWNLTGSVNYTRPLSGTDLQAFVYADTSYRSAANVSYSATTSSQYFQKGYPLTDLRVGLGREDRRWQVEFWVRNLFDTKAWAGLYTATAQAGSIEGFAIEPRFFGATLRTHF